MNYPEYKDRVKELILNGSNTGEWTEARMNFTKLNYSRMKRMDTKIEVPAQKRKVFENLQHKQLWILLIESWCGDGAHTVPVLNKLAEINLKIELKILLRDQNSELMDLFLTQNSRSIPKLIVIDENLNELATWGPRSKAANKIMEDYRKEHGKIDDQIKKELQIWYNRNKGQEIISELATMENQIIYSRLKEVN